MFNYIVTPQKMANAFWYASRVSRHCFNSGLWTVHMRHLWGTRCKEYHCAQRTEAETLKLLVRYISPKSFVIWCGLFPDGHSFVLCRSSARTSERCVACARSPVLEVLRNNSARSPRRASHRRRKIGGLEEEAARSMASGGSSPLLHSCCQVGAIPAFHIEISRNKIEWYRGL